MHLNGKKIAVAQVASTRGDIAGNLHVHEQAMLTAHENGVSLLLFPELSLIGYEVDLAATLAVQIEDSRLLVLADLARALKLQTVVGAPLSGQGVKPFLGAIIFSTEGNISTYHKMHLGGDESLYFDQGREPKLLSCAQHKVGLAICADTSHRTHLESCIALGADVYAASTFLTKEWFEGDSPRLQTYAKQYGILTLLANHGASVGTLESWGCSAAWAPDGRLLGQVIGTRGALLIASQCNQKWQAEVVEL